MTRLRTFLAAAIVFVIAAAMDAPRAEAAVYIVRHAEKQTEANDREVPLSEAGRARAEHIAAMLQDAGIVAIYSTDTVRTLATAEPLARAKHLKPVLYDAPGPDAMKALALRIRKEHGTGNVLVVGHSNTVAPLVQALGSAEEIRIEGADYDGLWIVVPAPSPATNGAPLVLRLHQ
jgi:phosphohistidine phosphatase SixA